MKYTILAALLAALVAGCGGHGHAEPQAPGEPTITKPLEGYAPDGTLLPEAPSASEKPAPGASEPGDASNPPAPIDTSGPPVDPIDKPCKPPQASDAGIEHGKPPVGRCDVPR